MSSKSDNVAKLRAVALKVLAKQRHGISVSMEEALEMTKERPIKIALRELTSPGFVPAFIGAWFQNLRFWR